MELTVLLSAIVLIVCIFSHKLASRFGFPVLALFIALGMIAGDSGFGYHFSDFKLAEQLCSFALVFIMFYGGFGTNWKAARPVAPQAFLLSSFGVVLTALLTGVFCRYVVGMNWLEGLLVGSVIGSTDAASVFSILRSRKLNLKYNTASLLELESGSNDPTAYTLTVIILALMEAQSAVGADGAGKILVLANGMSPGLWAMQLLAAQIIIGLTVGLLAALISRKVFQYVDFEGSGLATIFVVSVALAAYALPSLIGGNGYLSTYIAGIILGNSKIRHKIGLVHFFDGLNWIMQIILFFVLGLLAVPSEIPAIALTAVLITLFLTFIARPAAVVLILSFFKTPWRQQVLVAWAGLRGSSSIVFAILAGASRAYTKIDIFHIVFTAALLSVSFQGTLLPVLARKLNLVDDSDSVSKTFNDYIDPTAMRLIDMVITDSHEWANKLVKDIILPPKSLLVLIKRGTSFLVPKGNTLLLSGDVLVMNSSTHFADTDIPLREEVVGKKHPWCGATLKDIEFPENTLVVMINRGEDNIVPDGMTRIFAKDVLVLTDVPIIQQT